MRMLLAVCGLALATSLAAAAETPTAAAGPVSFTIYGSNDCAKVAARLVYAGKVYNLRTTTENNCGSTTCGGPTTITDVPWASGCWAAAPATPPEPQPPVGQRIHYSMTSVGDCAVCVR